MDNTPVPSFGGTTQPGCSVAARLPNQRSAQEKVDSASAGHGKVVVVVEEADALGLGDAKLALQVAHHVPLARGRWEEVELNKVHGPVDARAACERITSRSAAPRKGRRSCRPGSMP